MKSNVFASKSNNCKVRMICKRTINSSLRRLKVILNGWKVSKKLRNQSTKSRERLSKTSNALCSNNKRNTINSSD
jgi:hypothetical protein